MKKVRLILVATMMVVLLPLPVMADEDASPVLNIRSITHELAMKIVVTAVDACTKLGYKVTASMAGRDGNLLALLRNPLSGPHTVDVSMRKAYTAASFQVPTASLAEENPFIAHADGVVLVHGGVPMSVGGHIYGGVGVSGASPEDDGKCAQIGIDMAADILEFAD